MSNESDSDIDERPQEVEQPLDALVVEQNHAEPHAAEIVVEVIDEPPVVTKPNGNKKSMFIVLGWLLIKLTSTTFTAVIQKKPTEWFLKPYISLIRGNANYRTLLISNIISGLGDWFNIIASLSVVNKTQGSAFGLAIYTIVQSAPALLLSPVIGIIVDRFDKKTIMIISLIFRALTMIGLIFAQTPDTLWLLYTLTFVKHAFSSLYQPARTAIVPGVVEKSDLVTANSIDGIVWSCMLFVGGAAGGFATSLFGITAAYILDAISYMIAAYFLGFLYYSGAGFGTPLVRLGVFFSQLRLRFAKPTAYNPYKIMLVSEDEDEQRDPPSVDGIVIAMSDSGIVSPSVDGVKTKDTPVTPSEVKEVKPVVSSLQLALDGFRYMFHVKYIFALCFFKGTLQLGLGIVDMINIRSAQTIFAMGEAGSLSLGLNYMVVGIGTIVSPFVARRFGRQTPKGVQFLLCFALFQLSLGAIFLALSNSYVGFLMANLFRSGSTSIAQIYSSLILQQCAAAEYRGRVFSFEQAITTLLNLGVRIFAGYAIDDLGWTVFQLDAVAAVAAAFAATSWTFYFWLANEHVKFAYEAVGLDPSIAKVIKATPKQQQLTSK